MSLRLTWHLRCDMCDGDEYLGVDGVKYIDADGRFEFDRLYAEYGYRERPDGLIQCENHPRSVDT